MPASDWSDMPMLAPVWRPSAIAASPSRPGAMLICCLSAACPGEAAIMARAATNRTSAWRAIPLPQQPAVALPDGAEAHQRRRLAKESRRVAVQADRAGEAHRPRAGRGGEPDAQ